MNAKKVLFGLALAFLVGFIVFVLLRYYTEYKKEERRKAGWSLLGQQLEKEILGFKGETGIVVRDITKGRMLSYGGDKKFPSASLTKIPIMVACFDAIRKNKIDPAQVLKLKQSDKVAGSGLLKDMPVGTPFSVEKLIELMICESDNTATNILIDKLGLDYLNACFKQIGLEDTNLSRKMMDFKSRRAGIDNYTSARDMALVLDKIYRKEFGKEVSEKCMILLKKQKINNRIPAKLPSGCVVAHKTGLEKNICHDVGIVFTAKGDFIICVLTKAAKNTGIAKDFISKVAFDVYDYYMKY